jgi:lysophospholipase L1-like esterase
VGATVVIAAVSTTGGGPADGIPAAQDPAASTVVFIGDSWTDGAGATDRVGFAHLTGEQLGGPHWVLGIGGSGYVVPEAGRTYADRIPVALRADPDLVVVQGSLNERNTPLPDLAPAVARTLTRLRVELGEAGVLVLGASYVPGVPDEVIDGINDTIRAAAEQLGLRFVDVAAESWTDPADPSVWADPIHPNDRGHLQIAQRLAPLIAGSSPAGHDGV